jgi:hypothetical protein
LARQQQLRPAGWYLSHTNVNPERSTSDSFAANAVVLLSGGLDSTTVLAIAKSEGFAVHALSFRYGQRHSAEIGAARRIAHRAGADVEVCPNGQAALETFERRGFIWGGKWWHFDTMHFEYRPEIIAYAKSVAASAPGNKSAH